MRADALGDLLGCGEKINILVTRQFVDRLDQWSGYVLVIGLGLDNQPVSVSQHIGQTFRNSFGTPNAGLKSSLVVAT